LSSFLFRVLIGQVLVLVLVLAGLVLVLVLFLVLVALILVLVLVFVGPVLVNITGLQEKSQRTELSTSDRPRVRRHVIPS